jgi:predicted RND superfamily exporter protein
MMGLVLGAVIIIITLLEGSFKLAVVLALVIISVFLISLGCLSMIGVPLSVYTIVNLTMCIGLTVEFSSHIGRTFLFARGDLKDRMSQTLGLLMFPTFAGAFTTFISVVPLQFSDIRFFHDHYFQTYAIFVILGFAGGVILLPALLGLINVSTHESVHELEEDDILRNKLEGGASEGGKAFGDNSMSMKTRVVDGSAPSFGDLSGAESPSSASSVEVV